MNNELEKKDTLWTHEPPKEPGWYWRIYRRSPRAEHTPEWTPPVAILVTERRDGLYVDEWRVHADGAFRWCHTPIPPPPLSYAPVLSPSETEEDQPVYASSQVWKLELGEPFTYTFEVISLATYKQDVEAAYREAFDTAIEQVIIKDEVFDEDWKKAWSASEAKKKLEGMK